MFRARTGLLGSAILIACALVSAGGNAPAIAGTPSSAADWSGTWHGTYMCYQGVTGLDLTITPRDAKTVKAVFSFHAVLQNPLVPSGEFEMLGRLGPSPGRLLLRAKAWADRPPNYVTVDLDGIYDPGSAEYSGRVKGPGCTSFRVTRGTSI
jgi:hypothetical protein